MNDHHLDDLIIGDPEPGSGNSKGLLTIIALLIVILIVGLILWALLFQSSDTPSTSAPSAAQPTQTLDPNLIPLDKNGAEKPAPVSKPVKKPSPKPKPQTVSKPAPKPVTQPAPAPTHKVTKPTTPAASKPKAQKPAPVKTTPAATATKEGTVLIKNAGKTIYYIQVGAFKRDPSPKFMTKLKENGFTFITKRTNNMRRVRVGPYDSYDQAKAALPEIKAKLGINGLIVKF